MYQNNENILIIDEAGSWLSLVTKCCITLAEDRPAFKCVCGIYFPFYLVYQKDEKTILYLHQIAS